MSPQIVYTLLGEPSRRNHGRVPFSGDVDVMRCLYHRLEEWLCGRLPGVGPRYSFDDFAHVDVSQYESVTGSPDEGPRPILHVRMRLPDTPGGSWNWCCRVFGDDWTVRTGIYDWRAYDWSPLVASRAAAKWRAVRRRLRAWARAAVVFAALLEELQLRPGGAEYRCAKARFEAALTVH